MTHDLAMLQYTIRMSPLPPYPATVDQGGAFRGWVLYMEGNLYPAGTIPGTPDEPVLGWDPASAPHAGTWFGWGFLVEDLNRTQSTDPTFVLTSQYVFGVIGPDNYFPVDQMVSSGLEFSHTDQTQPDLPHQDAIQPVTGGAGMYAGARGTVRKRYIGTNTSGPNDGAHSPRNYRLTFDISG